MEDFHRQFLSETVETLENLHQNLQNSETISDSRRREVFRTLHTVKGTAQTFGFDTASRLAHELETLLADGENTRNLLLEGIEILRRSLIEGDFQIPENFTENLRAVLPNADLTAGNLYENPAEIPPEIYSQLSNREKKLIGAAMREGKILAVSEIGFEAANFAVELINFREKLNSSGEIIATFPSAKFSGDGKIGFQFLTASAEIITDTANVGWSFAPPKRLNDVSGVLREIIRHGREIASKLDKRIGFETQNDEIKLSSAELKLVFEVLLHLVRNAVDHAIERVGKIEIRVKKEADNLRLSVADDGRGIDLKQVKSQAVEKKLIADENLSETEIINLIFQPEFSTKAETTEISGRGIGLDAVKYGIEKFGGKITIATEKGKGTTFEITLPRNESETG